MRVLVCTVGGSPAPVINAIRQNEPSFTYFLCSAGEKPESASVRTILEETTHTTNATCTQCGKRFEAREVQPAIAPSAGLTPDQYHIETVADPDDLHLALSACAAIERQIAQRFGAVAVEVVANYTGATKGMALGLGLHAQRCGWLLQFQTSPRRDLAKITSGDVAVGQDTAQLLARHSTELAEATLDRHDYEGAVTIVTRALITSKHHHTHRGDLLRLRSRAAMLAARDRFDYDDAIEHARQAELTDEVSTLRVLRGARDRMAGDEEISRKDLTPYELVRDLKANALRCAKRRRYDDAVGRLYRAVELLAQVRLRVAHGLRTDAIPLTDPRITLAARAWLERHREGTADTARIGSFLAYQLLQELGDPLGEHFTAHDKEIRRCLEIRNQSLFAHGLRPIGERAWHDVGDWLCGWLAAGVALASGSEQRPKGVP